MFHALLLPKTKKVNVYVSDTTDLMKKFLKWMSRYYESSKMFRDGQIITINYGGRSKGEVVSGLDMFQLGLWGGRIGQDFDFFGFGGDSAR